MKTLKTIKELRISTGLSQSQFSKEFDIPVRTLQQWEQGKSHPAPYVINLIERRIIDMDACDHDIYVKENSFTSKRILVVGQGSFGQAITKYLKEKGHDVTTWKRGESAEEASKDKGFFIFAIPAQSFREVFSLFSPYIGSSIVINLAKGIEISSLKRLSEVCFEIKEDTNYVVLSGPSHAEEIYEGLPTDVTISSNKRELLSPVQEILFSKEFRVYTNDDLVGVEVGGSLKNVIAIASGICDGLNLGDNAKAALITRGLAEMRRLGEKLGANPLTFLGLSGVGDLIVTCGSMHSRNRRFGILLGQGLDTDTALKEVGQVVEGMSTCRSVYLLSKELGVDMPITSLLYHLLNNEISLESAYNLLVSREKKAE